MRKTQKIATLVVTAAMGLALAACSTSSTTTTTVSTSDGETTKTTTTSSTSTSSSSDAADTASDAASYTNSELKFGYDIPADLNIRFASEQELNQINGFEFTNDNIAQKLDEGSSVVFMYATDGNGDNVKLSAIKTAGTKLASTPAADLLKQFADAAAKGVEGATVEDAQSGTYTLNGKEYPVQTFTLVTPDAKTYCAIAGAASGDHFVWYTVDTHDQARVERLLSGISGQQ